MALFEYYQINHSYYSLNLQIMLIKYISPLLRNSLSHRPIAPFNIFTDKIKQKGQQKRQKQFKEEIQHLANKPSFTIMDYKQRTIDQLNKLKKSITSKVSSEKIQQQKALTEEKTILNAIFEEELVQQQPIKGSQKKQIALVTQIPLDKVNNLLKKVQEYKKMHKLLHQIKQANQPLPQSMDQLQYLYMKSGIMHQGKKTKYMKYQSRSRAQRYNYLKYGKVSMF